MSLINQIKQKIKEDTAELSIPRIYGIKDPRPGNRIFGLEGPDIEWYKITEEPYDKNKVIKL